MDTYEITSEFERLQGVGLRYRLREAAKKAWINLEAENLPNNVVSFTVPSGTDITPIREFLKSFRPKAKIRKVGF